MLTVVGARSTLTVCPASLPATAPLRIPSCAPALVRTFVVKIVSPLLVPAGGLSTTTRWITFVDTRRINVGAEALAPAASPEDAAAGPRKRASTRAPTPAAVSGSGFTRHRVASLSLAGGAAWSGPTAAYAHSTPGFRMTPCSMPSSRVLERLRMPSSGTQSGGAPGRAVDCLARGLAVAPTLVAFVLDGSP